MKEDKIEEKGGGPWRRCLRRSLRDIGGGAKNEGKMRGKRGEGERGESRRNKERGNKSGAQILIH